MSLMKKFTAAALALFSVTNLALAPSAQAQSGKKTANVARSRTYDANPRALDFTPVVVLAGKGAERQDVVTFIMKVKKNPAAIQDDIKNGLLPAHYDQLLNDEELNHVGAILECRVFVDSKTKSYARIPGEDRLTLQSSAGSIKYEDLGSVAISTETIAGGKAPIFTSVSEKGAQYPTPTMRTTGLTNKAGQLSMSVIIPLSQEEKADPFFEKGIKQGALSAQHMCGVLLSNPENRKGFPTIDPKVAGEQAEQARRNVRSIFNAQGALYKLPAPTK